MDQIQAWCVWSFNSKHGYEKTLVTVVSNYGIWKTEIMEKDIQKMEKK